MLEDGRRRIVDITSEIQLENGISYCLFYDSNGALVSDVSKYANSYHFLGYSSKTKALAICVLKKFCAYREIYGIQRLPLEDYHTKEIAGLVHFLQGKNSADSQFSGIPGNSNKTVNLYLSQIRNFFTFMGVSEHCIFEKVAYYSSSGYGAKYKANVRNGSFVESPPDYVSMQEFAAIIKIVINEKNRRTPNILKAIENIKLEYEEYNHEFGTSESFNCPEYDDQALIILILMQVNGLRIGTILGLTEEDFEKKPDDFGLIWLRNRCSDKDFQYVKNLEHPSSQEEYTSSGYKTAAYTRFIPIDIKEYEMIQNFIRRSHEIHSRAYPENFQTTKADSVTGKVENYYVFRNSYAKLLTDQAWNKQLKKIMTEAGLEVDKGKRKHNLNHRFRHGKAMAMIESGCSLEEIRQSLLHASMQSCTSYINPTIQDQLRIKERFLSFQLENHPDLKLLFEKGLDEL